MRSLVYGLVVLSGCGSSGSSPDAFGLDGNGVDSSAPIDASPDASNVCTGAGKIVFVRGDDAGDGEIAKMLSDGSSLQVLTENAVNDSFPRWSPDGAKIAWMSSTDNKAYVMDADGSDQFELSDTGRLPSWFPDGSRLVLIRRPDEYTDLYTIRPDGTDLRQLTTNPGGDFEAQVSPDGSLIAYVSYELDGSQPRIWVMNADGTARTALTPPGLVSSDRIPSWSRDSSRLAFSRSQRLWTMDRDGGNATALGVVVFDHIEWSPDDSMIAFQGFAPEVAGYDVFTVHADGTNLVNLSNAAVNPEYNSYPRWSPDGSWVTFHTRSAQRQGIYKAHPDGSGLAPITTNGGDAEWVACQ